MKGRIDLDQCEQVRFNIYNLIFEYCIILQIINNHCS